MSGVWKLSNNSELNRFSILGSLYSPASNDHLYIITYGCYGICCDHVCVYIITVIGY